MSPLRIELGTPGVSDATFVCHYSSCHTTLWSTSSYRTTLSKTYLLRQQSKAQSMREFGIGLCDKTVNISYLCVIKGPCYCAVTMRVLSIRHIDSSSEKQRSFSYRIFHKKILHFINDRIFQIQWLNKEFDIHIHNLPSFGFILSYKTLS